MGTRFRPTRRASGRERALGRPSPRRIRVQRDEQRFVRTPERHGTHDLGWRPEPFGALLGLRAPDAATSGLDEGARLLRSGCRIHLASAHHFFHQASMPRDPASHPAPHDLSSPSSDAVPPAASVVSRSAMPAGTGRRLRQSPSRRPSPRSTPRVIHAHGSQDLRRHRRKPRRPIPGHSGEAAAAPALLQRPAAPHRGGLLWPTGMTRKPAPLRASGGSAPRASP